MNNTRATAIRTMLEEALEDHGYKNYEVFIGTKEDMLKVKTRPKETIIIRIEAHEQLHTVRDAVRASDG